MNRLHTAHISPSSNRIVNRLANHTDPMEKEEHGEPVSTELTEFQTHNAQITIETLPIFTRLQLSTYNGTTRPQLYVAIRGYIYDVSNNEKNYGPNGSYHRLVGRDVSRLLGLNRLHLKPQDVVKDVEGNTWYTEDLTEKQNSIVDKWVEFFKKRYYIVGVVVDHQGKK